MLGSISVTPFAQQVATAYGDRHGAGAAWPWRRLVLTFAMLVALARIGRAAEMRRDLDGTSKKGSVMN